MFPQPTRQGIRIFTMLTGIAILGILLWHILNYAVRSAASAQDYVLVAALFGVFLGGIYPGYAKNASLGRICVVWIGASVVLGTLFGLVTGYLVLS